MDGGCECLINCRAVIFGRWSSIELNWPRMNIKVFRKSASDPETPSFHSPLPVLCARSLLCVPPMSVCCWSASGMWRGREFKYRTRVNEDTIHGHQSTIIISPIEAQCSCYFTLAQWSWWWWWRWWSSSVMQTRDLPPPTTTTHPIVVSF